MLKPPSRFVQAALRGDVRPALGDLEPPWAARARGRFVTREERPDPTGLRRFDAIRARYWAYWAAALVGEAGAEARLEASLRAITGCPEDEDFLAACAEALLAEGVRVANGRTPPLLDLLAWRGHDERAFEVPLTDGARSVRVVMISDVVSRGWSHFATLGAASTGGWATADRLYCLAAGADPSGRTPHGAASHRLIEGLTRRVGDPLAAPHEDVRVAARALLAESDGRGGR